jgi:mannose-1-phosphate guanylyltransferase / mannose-6-phosphate isomerase
MLIHPVILSGGAGTRLWPLSREHYPKQLLPLAAEQTLVQQTITRLVGIDHVVDPVFVCNEEHRFLIAEQVAEIGKRAGAILLEPAGRNTCPAVTVAALHVKSLGDDTVMLIMPADHVIQDVTAFQEAVRNALPLALDGRLVTFGVVPVGAATGYGYIRRGDGNSVAEFVEKPDRERAMRYVVSGEYFWNSGMFLMRASTWLEEMSRLAPDILECCTRAFSAGQSDGSFFRLQQEAFLSCRSDSIDYAVMEKTARAAVVPLKAGWSDVGSWSTLWEVSQRDSNGNLKAGDVCLHDTQDSLILAHSRLVAAVGIKNAVVVETPDAVLVMNKDSDQDVKHVVAALKAKKRSEYVSHRRVYRPWGCYESVDSGERFQVKRLTVKPGAALSLQMHHHRAEHWVVVRGTARVTRGEETFMLTENQSTYIPIGVSHRLENPGTIPLEIVEVQSGSYLGEDDIVRFTDKYNRVKN